MIAICETSTAAIVSVYLKKGTVATAVVQRALGEQCEPALHDTALPYTCDKVRCRYTSKECGNGVIDPGEGCDNGNMNSNAANQRCRIDCSLARCGDGAIDDLSGEQCDDGNIVSVMVVVPVVLTSTEPLSLSTQPQPRKSPSGYRSALFDNNYGTCW